MQALKAAVIIMGVLIVLGVVTLGVALTQKLSGAGGSMANLLLDEPAGTRITATSMAPDRLSLQLTGGGPDRVVVIDTRASRVVGRVALSR